MQLDTIPAITTTTTTDTVTTITTTTTKTVTTIHNAANYHFFTHSIDYSKYTDNIISSLIDNIIDDIQVEVGGGVPEPGTTATLLGGLCLCVLASRRRR